MFINLSVQRNLVSFLIIKTFEGAYLLYLNRLIQFRKCIKKIVRIKNVSKNLEQVKQKHSFN